MKDKRVNAYSSLANRRYKYALLKKIVPYRNARRLANWSWSHIIQYLTSNFPIELAFTVPNISVVDFYADCFNRELTIYFSNGDMLNDIGTIFSS